MPAIATNLDCPNPADADILNNVLKGDFTKHLNISDLFNVLNKLFSVKSEKVDELPLITACRIKKYMKSNLIKNIFDYFTQNIYLNKKNLDDNLKSLLIDFSNDFLAVSSSLYSESKNSNFVDQHHETFNSYFIFLNSLYSIFKLNDIKSKNNHNAFSLINLSKTLLIIISKSNSTNTTLTEASVTHFFSGLGHLVFNLGLTHGKELHIVVQQEGHKANIEEIAKSLYDNIKSKVDTSILVDAIRRYSINLHDGDIEAAEQHCLDLFNQTCLSEKVSTTATVKNIINTVATKNSTILNTDLLSSEALRTEAFIEESTTANSSLQGNVTLSSYNSTRNGTEVDATLITSSYRMPSALELGTAAGHGIGNGVINAASQQLAEYLNRTGYSRSKIAPVINLTSTLLHSAYAAALPLMLTSLQNPDVADENTADEMWQKLIPEVIPSFVTNLVFSLGFQGLNYCQAHYLSGYPTVKAAVQTIPVVSTAYAAISAPISTAVNIGAAAMSSLLTKSVFHFFAPATKKKVSESTDLEVGVQLITNKNSAIPHTAISNINNSNLSKGSIYFLKSEQLETVKENSIKIITRLNNMSDIYIKANDEINSLKQILNKKIDDGTEKEMIASSEICINKYEKMIANNKIKLEIIDSQKSKLSSFNALLSEDSHSNACGGFPSAEDLVKNTDVQNLWGLMKTMMDQKILEELEKALCSINGIDPSKLITCPNPIEYNKQLGEHISIIKSCSPLVKSVLQSAVRIYDAKQQGVTAAKEAKRLNNSVIILRNNDGGINTVRYKTNDRRNTYNCYSSASNSSNGSTTLSTLSASSECDPIEEQQERLLLPRP